MVVVRDGQAVLCWRSRRCASGPGRRCWFFLFMACSPGVAWPNKRILLSLLLLAPLKGGGGASSRPSSLLRRSCPSTYTHVCIQHTQHATNATQKRASRQPQKNGDCFCSLCLSSGLSLFLSLAVLGWAWAHLGRHACNNALLSLFCVPVTYTNGIYARKARGTRGGKVLKRIEKGDQSSFARSSAADPGA